MKRIFVKFYGFSDAERHALDTLFRLSESHDTVYSAWTPEAPEPPEVLFVDGASWEAVVALANPAHDDLKLVWVGEDPPEQAWRVFAAPVKWSAVLEAMDAEFASPSPPPTTMELTPMDSHPIELDLPHEHDMDVHLDGGDDTEPLPLEPGTVPNTARVLVVDAERDDRLYLRAKLAAAGLHDVDEASCGAEALALLNTHSYRLVTVDLALRDMSSWQLLKAVNAIRPAVAHVLVTGSGPAWLHGVRARFSGAHLYLRKPLDPVRLQLLLQNI